MPGDAQLCDSKQSLIACENACVYWLKCAWNGHAISQIKNAIIGQCGHEMYEVHSMRYYRFSYMDTLVIEANGVSSRIFSLIHRRIRPLENVVLGVFMINKNRYTDTRRAVMLYG